MFGINNLLQCDQFYYIGCFSLLFFVVFEGEWFCLECVLEVDVGLDELFKLVLGIIILKLVNGKKGVKQDVVEIVGNFKVFVFVINGVLIFLKFVKGGKRLREDERSV